MTERKINAGQRGFTILEMVVTTGLVGVLAFIALPQASAVLDQYHLVTAANRIGMEVVRARAQAVAQGTPIRVRLQDQAGRPVLKVDRYNDATQTWTPTSQDTSLATGIQLGSTTNTGTAGTGYGGTNGPATGNPTVAFGRNGLAAASVTFTIKNRAGRRQIQVNRLRSVKIL